MNGQLEARRVGLGAAAVGVLVLAMMAFSVLPASARSYQRNWSSWEQLRQFSVEQCGDLEPDRAQPPKCEHHARFLGRH